MWSGGARTQMRTTGSGSPRFELAALIVPLPVDDGDGDAAVIAASDTRVAAAVPCCTTGLLVPSLELDEPPPPAPSSFRMPGMLHARASGLKPEIGQNASCAEGMAAVTARSARMGSSASPAVTAFFCEASTETLCTATAGPSRQDGRTGGQAKARLRPLSRDDVRLIDFPIRRRRHDKLLPGGRLIALQVLDVRRADLLG